MSNQAPDPLAAIYEALRIDPNNGSLFNSLGCIYYKRGQLSEAIPIFEKAIRLSPTSAEAHYNLANCYVKQDLLEQAISHYLAALKIQPDNTNAQVNLAMTYVSLKQYAEALPWLEKAAALEPDFAELQGHLAEAYLDLGKTKEAILQFELATQLEPSRAAWQHNLAVLYLRNKQHALAAERFATALSLDPNNATAMHMLNALRNNNATDAPSDYVEDLFDQYAGYYNKHVKEHLDYQVPQMLRQAIGKVLTAHATQQNILDLGCGTGLCGIYFRDLARYLVGVDLSDAMLQQAKASTAYDALCRADIKQFFPGMDTNYFDIIIAADVFVYIGDLSQIFANAKSSLKKNALLAFTVEETEQNYALQTSGRFAHSTHYIKQLANKYHFSVEHAERVTLRQHEDEAVAGILYVLKNN